MSREQSNWVHVVLSWSSSILYLLPSLSVMMDTTVAQSYPPNSGYSPQALRFLVGIASCEQCLQFLQVPLKLP